MPATGPSAWFAQTPDGLPAESLDRSVENPPAFIPLGGAQPWPHAMAAHWRSRLRIGHGKGVREQGTEPGTLVTGQVFGATAAGAMAARSKIHRFSSSWVDRRPMDRSLTVAARKA